MSKEIPPNIGFSPIASKNSQILILGSMPSIKSLDQQQYYAHPRNAFWPILSTLCKMEENLTYAQRCQQLIKHQFAVWDVLQSCQRQGSLDANIDPRSVIVNDFTLFFQHHPHIRRIFFNGTKAQQLFKQYVLITLEHQHTEILRQRLPSTSPAHASLNFEQKLALWQQALSI